MTLDSRSTHPVVRELRGDSVLDEAHRIVHGSRQADYGHPLDNWSATATMMTGVLQAAGVLRDGAVVTAETSVLLMEVVKVAREAGRPKRDNRVDGPGYWEVLDILIEERERRSQRKAD